MTRAPRWLETVWGQTTWAVVLVVLIALPMYTHVPRAWVAVGTFLWAVVFTIGHLPWVRPEDVAEDEDDHER